MKEARTKTDAAITRIADRIDLAIDMLTLGQYGLEVAPAGGAGREGSGRCAADWEAPPPARPRGGCEWPWPARCRSAAVPTPG